MITKLRQNVPYTNEVLQKKINEIIEWINGHEKNPPGPYGKIMGV